MSPPARKKLLIATLLAAALALFAVPIVVPLLAQQPAQSPPADQAPPNAAEAIQEHADDTLEQVKSGEVSLAEATRDPASAPDPGSSAVQWFLAIVVGRLFLPIVKFVVQRMPQVENAIAPQINGVVVLLLYLGVGWGWASHVDPSLPQSWLTWGSWALGAVGLTTMTSGSGGGS